MLPLVFRLVFGSRDRRRDAELLMLQEKGNLNGMSYREARRVIKRERRQRRRDAREIRRAARSSLLGMPYAVTIVIPQGVQPNTEFSVYFRGQSYQCTCPARARPGDKVSVPITSLRPVATISSAPTIPAAIQVSSSSAPSRQNNEGEIPVAYVVSTTQEEGGPEKALDDDDSDSEDRGFELLRLIEDHKVDEKAPEMSQFGIISLKEGTDVELLEGNLQDGLDGADFGEYILVAVPSQGFREGLISRHVVKPVSQCT
mmetsp:Transcript_18102/g.35582  ORF Transcript_18102/g.35582 Transcript_18102/m.35582 type:complete len:258 (+) Transcript_18102:262-1035(+)